MRFLEVEETIKHSETWSQVTIKQFLCNGSNCSVCYFKFTCLTMPKEEALVINIDELRKIYTDEWNIRKVLKHFTQSGIYGKGTKKYKRTLLKDLSNSIQTVTRSTDEVTDAIKKVNAALDSALWKVK